MDILQFVAIRNAKLYNPDADPRDEAKMGDILGCDEWIWDYGALFGMRKVYTINGASVNNRFIKDSDLLLADNVPTEPPSDWPEYFVLENPETGERQRYNKA